MEDNSLTQTLRMNGEDTILVSLLPADPNATALEQAPTWTEWRMWMMGHGGAPSAAEALIEYNRLARRTQAIYSKMSTAEKDKWWSLYYSERDYFPPFPLTDISPKSGAPNGLSKFKRSDGTSLPKLHKDDK